MKDRLKTIDQYWGVPSKQTVMYQLIDKVVPPAISVNGITVNRNGETVLLASSPDSENLDNLISELTTQKSSVDVIKEVTVERLSRGRDGVYRVSLKIKPR